jgi:flagellar biosynthesis protein FliQ
VPAALSLLLDALYLAIWLSLPVLAVSYAVGALTGLLQSLTKLSEPALNAIPRALATLLVLSVCGGFMAGELARFTEKVLTSLPELVR